MNVIAPTPYHIAPPPRVRVGHERACVCACATLFPQRRNSCYISGLFGVRACSGSEMPPLRSQKSSQTSMETHLDISEVAIKAPKPLIHLACILKVFHFCSLGFHNFDFAMAHVNDTWYAFGCEHVICQFDKVVPPGHCDAHQSLWHNWLIFPPLAHGLLWKTQSGEATPVVSQLELLNYTFKNDQH